MLDFLCFSHLRWDFVYQRPQHLLTRAAMSNRVFFWEEPIFCDVSTPELKTVSRGLNLTILQPHLPHMFQNANLDATLQAMLTDWMEERNVNQYAAWYYTPMALRFTSQLRPEVIIFDCMDELSAFKNAPPELHALEQKLFQIADVVFTGGLSLFESKRNQHRNVHLFPSSIDRLHFEKARLDSANLYAANLDPSDQRDIPHPRVGFFGVIDERLDIALLSAVAQLRPEMHFILIGPVVKIGEADLPRRHNLHYLGKKSYDELPAYIAGWDAAMLPFAMNESTQFISPTKTPEYLAAGKHVVSTPIRDVVRGYGEAGVVEIAGDAEMFAAALDRAVVLPDQNWMKTVDQLLASNSWDATWSEMTREIARLTSPRRNALPHECRPTNASSQK